MRDRHSPIRCIVKLTIPLQVYLPVAPLEDIPNGGKAVLVQLLLEVHRDLQYES